MRSVKTTVYDQNNNIQWYLNTFKAQKVQSPAKRFKELFCLVCNFFAPSKSRNEILTLPLIFISLHKPRFFLAWYWINLQFEKTRLNWVTRLK